MLMNNYLNSFNTLYLVIEFLINDQRIAQLYPRFILDFFFFGGGGRGGVL